MAVHGEQLVFKMWVTLALPPPTSWAGPIPEALGPPNHLLPPPLSIWPAPPVPSAEWPTYSQIWQKTFSVESAPAQSIPLTRRWPGRVATHTAPTRPRKARQARQKQPASGGAAAGMDGHGRVVHAHFGTHARTHLVLVFLSLSLSLARSLTHSLTPPLPRMYFVQYLHCGICMGTPSVRSEVR